MISIVTKYIIVLFTLLFGMAISPLYGKDEASRSFSIPQGHALDTLMLFAKQSGIGIVYQSVEVQNVQTQAVKGKKTPSEALKLMLSETPLGFIQDGEVSAIAIFRKKQSNLSLSSEDSGGHPEILSNNNSKHQDVTKMNKEKRRISKLLSGFVGFLIASGSPSISAQTNDSDVIDEDVYELSPFVISEDENVGYLATTTLAGTRIKSNLKDIASAISVITPEFMEDTGATDVGDLFTMTVGTEVGGNAGNFWGGGSSGLKADSNNSRINGAQSNSRVRGLAAPTYSRNFFTTRIATDSYNVSAITINRGPNSLLFGLGGAGGVVDTSLKQGIFGRNFGEIQARVGSQGSHRETIDYNASLLNDRLAIRVASLYKEEFFEQEPAYEREKRGYVTFAAKILDPQDSHFIGSMTLKGNYEKGTFKSNPYNPTPPIISYHAFFEAPPNLEQYTGNTIFPRMDQTFTKWGTIDNREYSESGRLMNHTAHVFNQTVLVFSENNSNARIGGNGDVADDAFFAGWRNNFNAPHINTRDIYENAETVGFKSHTLQDRNVFDYRKKLLTGNSGLVKRDFEAYSIVLEQMFLDDTAGIEVAYDHQFHKTWDRLPFGGGGRDSSVYIDGGEYLSYQKVVDGELVHEANPNVGRAMLLGQAGHTGQKWNTNDSNSVRATGFWQLDFTEKFDGKGKWLGRHSFTGVYAKERNDWRHEKSTLYWTSSKLGNDDWFGWTTAAWPRHVITIPYITGDLRGVEMSDIRLQQLNTPVIKDGDTFTGNYWNTTHNEFRKTTLTARRLRDGSNASRSETTSKVFSWQAFLLDDLLVGTAGWRSDNLKNWGASNFVRNLDDWSQAEPRGLAENTNTDLDFDTFTWGMVAHAPDKWLDKVKTLSSLSVHYNNGEAVAARGDRRSIYGKVFGPELSETTEYGFTVGLDENKWMLKFNWYETTSNNASASSSPANNASYWMGEFMNRYQSAYRDNIDWTTTEAYERGWESAQQVIDAIWNAYPEYVRTERNLRLDGEQWTQDPFEGLADITNRTAEGMEVEIVANPLPNWRIMLNVASQETKNSNSVAESKRFYDEVVSNLKAADLWTLSENSQSRVVSMERRMKSQAGNELVGIIAKDGQVSLEQRKWRWNAVTTYEFIEGKLSGSFIGGALRWQDEVATGYETYLDEDGNQLPHLDRPFMGDSDLRGDIWIGHKRKIMNGKIDWTISLTMRNIIGSTDDIPVFTNPDGQTAITRLAPEKSWFINSTFKF